MGDRLQDVLRAMQQARAKSRQDGQSQAPAGAHQADGQQVRRQPVQPIPPQSQPQRQAPAPFQTQPQARSDRTPAQSANNVAASALPFELQVMQRMGIQTAFQGGDGAAAPGLASPQAQRRVVDEEAPSSLPRAQRQHQQPEDDAMTEEQWHQEQQQQQSSAALHLRPLATPGHGHQLVLDLVRRPSGGHLGSGSGGRPTGQQPLMRREAPYVQRLPAMEDLQPRQHMQGWQQAEQLIQEDGSMVAWDGQGRRPDDSELDGRSDRGWAMMQRQEPSAAQLRPGGPDISAALATMLQTRQKRPMGDAPTPPQAGPTDAQVADAPGGLAMSGSQGFGASSAARDPSGRVPAGVNMGEAASVSDNGGSRGYDPAAPPVLGRQAELLSLQGAQRWQGQLALGQHPLAAEQRQQQLHDEHHHRQQQQQQQQHERQHYQQQLQRHQQQQTQGAVWERVSDSGKGDVVDLTADDDQEGDVGAAGQKRRLPASFLPGGPPKRPGPATAILPPGALPFAGSGGALVPDAEAAGPSGRRLPASLLPGGPAAAGHGNNNAAGQQQQHKHKHSQQQQHKHSQQQQQHKHSQQQQQQHKHSQQQQQQQLSQQQQQQEVVDPRQPGSQEAQLQLHLNVVTTRLREGTMPVSRSSSELRPMTQEERVRFEEAALKLQRQIQMLQQERMQLLALQQQRHWPPPVANSQSMAEAMHMAHRMTRQPHSHQPPITTGVVGGMGRSSLSGRSQELPASMRGAANGITRSHPGVLTGAGMPGGAAIGSGASGISGVAPGAGKPMAPLVTTGKEAGQSRVTEHQQALRAVIESLQVTGNEELEPPPKTLMVSVLRHQRMALAWMIRRETGAEPRGGILADDQGLGKTVTTISLIVTHTNPEECDQPREQDLQQGRSQQQGQAGGGSAAEAGDAAAGSSRRGSGGSFGRGPAGGAGGQQRPGEEERAEDDEEDEEEEDEEDLGAEDEGEEDVDACGVRLGALRAEREAAGAADAAEAEAAALDMVWDGADAAGLSAQTQGAGAVAGSSSGSGLTGSLGGVQTGPHGCHQPLSRQPVVRSSSEVDPAMGVGVASERRLSPQQELQPHPEIWVQGGDAGAGGSGAARQVKAEVKTEAGFGVKAEEVKAVTTMEAKAEVKAEEAQRGEALATALAGLDAATSGQPGAASSGGGRGAAAATASPPCYVNLVDDNSPVPQPGLQGRPGGAARRSISSGNDPDILSISEPPAVNSNRAAVGPGPAAPLANLPAAAASSLSQLASANLAASAATTTAALLASHRQQLAQAAAQAHSKALYEPDPPNLLPGGTLVVCPTSVLHQWAREIRDKVSPAAGLVVHVYHGKERVSTARQLAAMGVVLTTYGTLAQEAPSRDKQAVRMGRQGTSNTPINLAADDSGGEDPANAGGKAKGNRPRAKASSAEGGILYHIKWKRVVLDEAQSIKNPRTLAAHAAWRLFAHCRWCLSGTPIQNTVDDLYSYFRFIRYAPYCESRKFKELIKGKIAEKPEIGYKFLQAVLQAVLLRRTKQSTINGEPIIKLPARQQQLLKEKFSPAEAAFYTQVQADSLRAITEAREGGASGSRQYVNMLHSLLKLRQACNHPWLVRGGRTWHKTGTPSASEVEAARKLSPEARAALVASLSRGDAQCPCCGDIAEDPVASACSHVFCAQCLAAQKEGASVEGELLCPACSRLLRAGDLHSAAALAAVDPAAAPGRTGDDAGGSGSEWQSSAKVERLLAMLQGLRSKNTVAAQQAAGSRGGPANPLAVKSKSDKRLAGALRKLPPLQSGGASTSSGAGGSAVKPDKVIVFSQWTSMLDLLEIPLKKAKIVFRRLDGTMTVAHRERAIQDFESRTEVMVLLVSLKAAALGVNLTVANHVVLMDLWWNPTTEEQAIDRAHRIGQTRTVHVTRITIAGSVEDRILELQQAKKEVVAAALSEGRDGSAAAGRLTLEDLRFLFQGLAQ